MPATGWNNHDAAVAVSRRTDISLTERRQILAMLGLVEPDNTISPDPDPRAAAVLAASIHGASNTLSNSPPTARARNINDGPAPSGQHCPPGLRALFEGGHPVREPWQVDEALPKPVTAAKPKKTPKPRKPKPPRGVKPPKPPKPPKRAPEELQPCGTEAGYRRHIRHHEEVCLPCRMARRAADSARGKARTQARIAAGLAKPKRAARCGTVSGYKRHHREQTEVCAACRAEKLAESRRTGARRRALTAQNRQVAQAA